MSLALIAFLKLLGVTEPSMKGVFSFFVNYYALLNMFSGMPRHCNLELFDRCVILIIDAFIGKLKEDFSFSMALYTRRLSNLHLTVK